MNSEELYRWMVFSRELEAALCEGNPRWFPAEGEEATIVGSFCDLHADDVVAPHYRGPFVVYLMRGAEARRLAAQAFGKATGYNKGRSVPFNGPPEKGLIPWVAGDLGTMLGTATGAALALAQEGSDKVCVCSFGDGTANRGDFHENINLAAIWRLPIVYVCQNNGWAISQRAESYLPAPVADRAAGYGIPGISVDGNDVEAVRDTVGEAVARARRGEGPTLVEAMTWRAHGHWAGDKAAYRTEAEAATREDPLQRFADRLVERGQVTPGELDRIRFAVAEEVAVAVDQATRDAEAGLSELGSEEVYA